MRMRRSLWATVTTRAAQGDLRWVARAGSRVLRSMAGVAAPPWFATLAVTWRCNYRCFMCDFPLRRTPDPTTEELCERVARLERAGVLAIGITGGEPLLHPGLFEVIDQAARRRLLVHLNTNGSHLAEVEVPRLLEAGLHSINVSLDGAQARTHDELRRVPGSFAQIERTFRTLVRERRRGTPRLQLVMVVSRGNFRQVRSLVDLGASWGADSVGFLPHHAFVAPAEPFTEEEAAELDATLRAIADRTDHSTAYLAGFAPFLQGRPMPVRCSAPRTHLALDPMGNAFPCVPLMTLGRSGLPWAGRDHAPTSAAVSESDQREVCRRCWWNCHRELDLGIPLPATARTRPTG